MSTRQVEAPECRQKRLGRSVGSEKTAKLGACVWPALRRNSQLIGTARDYHLRHPVSADGGAHFQTDQGRDPEAAGRRASAAHVQGTAQTALAAPAG
jgi:hypothetical protein